MKVIATQDGYYNHIRQKEDTVFELTDPKHFSKNWMRKYNPTNASDPVVVDFEIEKGTGRIIRSKNE